MKNKQRLIALLLVFVLVFAGCGNKADKPAEDAKGGDYKVEVEGYGGKFEVTTSIDGEGKITKVEVGENTETDGIGSNAIKELPGKIVESQKVDIDVTSGATVTSEAILSAVEKAIEEAKLDVNNYKGGEKEEVTGELEFKPGTYEGEAIGYGGTVKVSVEVDEKAIKEVKVLEQQETKMISDLAFETIPAAIVEHQTVGVDSVSGCTFSSTAIKEAVKDALSKTEVNMDLATKAYVKEEVAKTDEEIEAEVVIIGGGGAGLSGAARAFENGAKKVVLVEKMPFLGGNTLRAGGAFNAADPEEQKKQGIEDSKEKHFEQTYEGGHKVGDEKLIKILTDNALDAVHWLADKGVEWKPTIGSVVGSMWPRSHQTEMPLGTGYISALEKDVKDNGGEILLNTKATELIVDGDKVVGIKAESEDKNYTIKADKGVIIAAGGYAADADMARKYLNEDGVYNNDNLPEKLESTNHPGATGDGIIMAEKIGAKVIDMEHIQLLPMPGDKFGPSINVEDSFFINKEGNRYVKEDGGRDELCLAAFAQPEGVYYMITDSQIVNEERKTLSGEDLDVLIKKGIVVEKDTLEELAEAIGVPADNLKKTTEEFNKSVDAQKDEFGRAVWGKKIEKGPFYATLRYPALHHTMGGLKINEQAQVLNTEDKVIEGLYAAGEVTGGIHGANRLGGNAIADIVVFGRIAGEQIMK